MLGVLLVVLNRGKLLLLLLLLMVLLLLLLLLLLVVMWTIPLRLNHGLLLVLHQAQCPKVHVELVTDLHHVLVADLAGPGLGFEVDGRDLAKDVTQPLQALDGLRVLAGRDQGRGKGLDERQVG